MGFGPALLLRQRHPSLVSWHELTLQQAQLLWRPWDLGDG